MIEVTAFRWVPPSIQGLVRDLRVRWALEEAGLPYQERLIGLGPEEQHSERYRKQQPFGQVPAYVEDGLVLFESGAIVLHVAERCEQLMPSEADAAARARTKTWIFAALNSVEPPFMFLNFVDSQPAIAAASQAVRNTMVGWARMRLTDLAKWLGESEYLEGRFTAGDLMVAAVLRIPCDTDLLTDYPTLQAYRRRCEARPAFQRALAAQLRAYAENAPPSKG
jgi:glutathione S-transferase